MAMYILNRICTSTIYHDRIKLTLLIWFDLFQLRMNFITIVLHLTQVLVIIDRIINTMKESVTETDQCTHSVIVVVIYTQHRILIVRFNPIDLYYNYNSKSIKKLTQIKWIFTKVAPDELF